MRLFDAVVLGELLWSAESRSILCCDSGASAGGEDGDQRRSFAPDVLQVRMLERSAALGSELTEARRRAERFLEHASATRCHALVFGDSSYPERLAGIGAPPPVLWLRGEPSYLARPAVALVGSRAGSTYACAVAEELGAELSARGVAVVSGLARGVDRAAHCGGLKGLGGTVAVLGCGVDVDYPREHATLKEQIVRTGAVVSELPPTVPPRRFHFPRRNRIISGLSLAVVVVEADTRSGSLITARAAAEQGREVMAVPGNVLTGRNRGGHALIKDGAKVVETADDILEEIGGVGGLALAEDAKANHVDHAGDPLLDRMEAGESYDLDTLVKISGLESSVAIARLVELELGGRVARSATGRFSRLREPRRFGYIG